jgi:UDP-N-acetylmuramyl tripeptide synthase
LAVVLGHAGNRRNEDYDAVAAVVAGFAPDLVVVKETETYLRGRAAGEVPALLRDALLRAGQSADRLIEADTEMGAAQRALSWAVAGDVVVLPLHAQGARDAVLTLLAQRRAGPAPP